MSLYGPLPAQNFLRLLKKVGEDTPNREACEEILDGLIDAVGAERGFLYRIRAGGGFRVLLARNRAGEAVARPGGRISHYAVRRSLDHRST